MSSIPVQITITIDQAIALAASALRLEPGDLELAVGHEVCLLGLRDGDAGEVQS